MNKPTLTQAAFALLLVFCIAFACFNLVHAFADMLTSTEAAVAYFLAGLAYSKITRRLLDTLEQTYVPRS